MRIIIFQDEIEEAIENLILEQVKVPDDMRIDIGFKASRGEEGYQAFIDIVDVNAPKGNPDRTVDPRITPIEGNETLGIAQKVAAAKAQAENGEQPVRRRGRPPGSKNKPKDGSVIQPVAQASQPAQAETVAENLLAPSEPVEAPSTNDLREKLQESVAQADTSTKESVVEIEPTKANVEEFTTLDEVLDEDGIREEVTEAAEKRVEEMKSVTETQAETVNESPQEAVAEPEVETPKPATRSLFANLGKPNS